MVIVSAFIICCSLQLSVIMGPPYSCRILQGSAERADSSNDGGPEFAEVFVIVWIGSMIVTLNSKLLGGNM